MNHVSNSRTLKGLSALLYVLLATLALWSGGVCISHWGALWHNTSYFDSTAVEYPLSDSVQQVYELLSLNYPEAQTTPLPYSQQQKLDQLMTALNGTNTNFRFQVHHQTTSQIIYSNLYDTAQTATADGTETTMSSWEITSLPAHQTIEFDLMIGGEYTSYDVVGQDLSTGRYYVDVYTPEETQRVYLNSWQETPSYGWMYQEVGTPTYSATDDSRVEYIPLVLEYGLDPELLVEDDYFWGATYYGYIQKYLPSLAIVALSTLTLALLLLCYLSAAAGRRRTVEGIHLSKLDGVPLELLLVFFVGLMGLMCLPVNQLFLYQYTLWAQMDAAQLICLALYSLLAVILSLMFYLSLVVRCKSRTLLTNTLVWRVCCWISRMVKKLIAIWPVLRWPAPVFLIYLLGSWLSLRVPLAAVVYQCAVFGGLFIWCKQWHSLRSGTAEILNGRTDHPIDTDHMFPDLREHADQLNNLGETISSAVEERLRSEHLRAELITNVSHDLKTPLTSIINYVDLLKKEELTQPKVQEYLEVLDRKSQRLKKLTEDLVEASKASAGTLTVQQERLDFLQFIKQAVGEYEEKLQTAQLELKLSLPDSPLYVEADGRHLWRVLDNLLGNCVKYAMPLTRVYLEAHAEEDVLVLTLKNISQIPLNLSPDELLGRFVRGDESRSTEGSGLGLSIAQSLTQLQGGDLELDIDGDLFKATVVFPLLHQEFSL